MLARTIWAPVRRTSPGTESANHSVSAHRHECRSLNHSVRQSQRTGASQTLGAMDLEFEHQPRMTVDLPPMHEVVGSHQLELVSHTFWPPLTVQPHSLQLSRTELVKEMEIAGSHAAKLRRVTSSGFSR